jgi:small subunit ribosomal protein S6e
VNIFPFQWQRAQLRSADRFLGDMLGLVLDVNLKGSFKNAVNNAYPNFREVTPEMAKFKIILSDPESGTSQVVELDGPRAVPLVGRRLGETLDGAALGFGGHKVKITGGSDKDGFPLRSDIHGGVKTRVVMAHGVGFHPACQGQRRRKTIRGNVITEEVVQINMTVVEKPRGSEKEKPKERVEEETEEKAQKTAVKETEKPKPKKQPKAAQKEAKAQLNDPAETVSGEQSSD